jgi:hypothetical protein
MQRVVSGVLSSVLSKYLSNIETQLSLSLFAGDSEIRFLDLALKNEAIQPLLVSSGLCLDQGTLGELKLSIPWMSLTSSPVTIEIKQVRVVLSLSDHIETSFSQKPLSSGFSIDDVEDSVSDAGSDINEAKEATGKGKGEGWIHKLLSKIISNVNFIIEDFSVCLKHEHVKFHFKLDRLEAFSIDSLFNRAFVELEGPWKTLRKEIVLQGAYLRLAHVYDHHDEFFYDSGIAKLFISADFIRLSD